MKKDLSRAQPPDISDRYLRMPQCTNFTDTAQTRRGGGAEVGRVLTN